MEGSAYVHTFYISDSGYLVRYFKGDDGLQAFLSPITHHATCKEVDTFCSVSKVQGVSSLGGAPII